MRLFAALPLSAEAIERLSRFRMRYGMPGDGLRWSEAEQWHLTLQFYGSIDGEKAECLRAALQNALPSAPEVVMEGYDLFAAKGILFASVRLNPGLRDVYQRVQATGSTCGVLPESRPFRPHITLARSKGRIGATTLERLAQPALPIFGKPEIWFPAELLLLESTLTQQGARYSAYARCPFSKPTSADGRT